MVRGSKIYFAALEVPLVSENGRVSPGGLQPAGEVSVISNCKRDERSYDLEGYKGGEG